MKQLSPISFRAVLVFGLGTNLLFKPILEHCEYPGVVCSPDFHAYCTNTYTLHCTVLRARMLDSRNRNNIQCDIICRLFGLITMMILVEFWTKKQTTTTFSVRKAVKLQFNSVRTILTTFLKKNMTVKKFKNVNVKAVQNSTILTEKTSYQSSYILRRPQNFAKSSPYFCPM